MVAVGSIVLRSWVLTFVVIDGGSSLAVLGLELRAAETAMISS